MILIKTKNEIDYIRESCKIVAETLQLVKKNAKPGVKLIELDAIAEDYIRSLDGRPAFKGYRSGGRPFPNTICASIDDEVVHGIPDDRILTEGQILSIDVGVEKKNFFGDAAITFAIGKTSDEKSKLMEATENSLYLGIKEAKAKNRVRDISYAIQSYVERCGYSVVRALTGHGVGKKLHEDPSVPNFGEKGTGAALKNGMTLAIEPMINLGDYDVFVCEDGWTVKTCDGKPSAHFEHTIAINDDEPEILTLI